MGRFRLRGVVKYAAVVSVIALSLTGCGTIDPAVAKSHYGPKVCRQLGKINRGKLVSLLEKGIQLYPPAKPADYTAIAKVARSLHTDAIKARKVPKLRDALEAVSQLARQIVVAGRKGTVAKLWKILDVPGIPIKIRDMITQINAACLRPTRSPKSQSG